MPNLKKLSQWYSTYYIYYSNYYLSSRPSINFYRPQFTARQWSLLTWSISPDYARPDALDIQGLPGNQIRLVRDQLNDAVSRCGHCLKIIPPCNII